MQILNSENSFVDVIIPTVGEPALDLSLQAIKRSVGVNHIILIGPEKLRLKYKNWENIVVIPSDGNVGWKRSLGLERVETKYFACIDSDVIVDKKWFNWCMKTLEDETVGACEGFGEEIGSHISRIRWREYKAGKDWLGLGCAMLRTDIVRQVGMPKIAYGEDYELMRRIRNIGYRWVCNPYLKVQHLVTDVMYWHHCSRWGEKGGNESVRPAQWLRSVMGTLTKGLLKYELSDCVFLCVGQFFFLYGHLKAIVRKTSLLERRKN